MALKRPFLLALTVLTVVSALVLATEFHHWREVAHYNEAVAAGRFADAEHDLGDYGLFAKAYAAHQGRTYQEARSHYSELERSHDPELRLAAQFNIGNTYLEEALGSDMKADADRALPLIELAKLSYRDVLQADSEHWDARHNLQRTLLLSPDLPKRPLMKLEGLRRSIRTNITGDPEGDLP